MSHTSDMTFKFNLWCYVEIDNTIIPVAISPGEHVGKLKKLIKEEKNILKEVDISNIILSKVNVHFNKDKRKKFIAGQYRPTLPTPDNDEVLHIMEPILELWPEPPSLDCLHVFVQLQDEVGSAGMTKSFPSDTLAVYDAAQKLHKIMWGNDLRSKLRDVEGIEGIKYLPPHEVDNLQLRKLGCNAEAILIHKEYYFTLNALNGRQNNSGGIVIMGHPGIGKSTFLYYALLHLLSDR
ncbi:hypothetical protein BGY98DRAFT_1093998 [Russula aff. rugulosa BPL654]|nr:hypothetical protein BGY98DRAFT_1093998 [Russula aff. rugulosa BPL654]